MPAKKKPTPKEKRGSLRDQREDQKVRRYLTRLPDPKGEAHPKAHTLHKISRKLNIPLADLRDFRDGNAEALDRSTVTLMNQLLGTNTAGMMGIDIDDPLGYPDPGSIGWLGGGVAEEGYRQSRLRQYALIDDTRPEAHAALHCWADMAVTGNIGESSKFAGGWEPVVYKGAKTTEAAIKDLERLVNDSLLPDDQKLLVFRGMVKYGDQWGEIGLSEAGGGKMSIDRLTPRHARTMYVNRGKDGKYNASQAYKQILPNRAPNDPVTTFPEWKIAHFANTVGWGDVYGQSIFEPCLRSHLQIESMESAMMIRRIERAGMRLKWLIDVGSLQGGDDEVRNLIDQFKRSRAKLRTVDNSKNFRVQKIAPPPEEDVFIAKPDKDSPADVSVLQGDQYIEAIGDFMHFWRKWMSGLGPPAAHLGYEDESSKTGINDKHIVFARKVRRSQIHFIAGLNHIYWVGLILRGIDPRTVRYAIFPPPMGTRDELIRAQILQTRATVANYLSTAFGVTGKVPSIPWVLKYVMELDDGVVDQLDLVPVIAPAGNSGFKKNPPPKNMKDKKGNAKIGILASVQPEVMEQVEVTKFLLNERAIQMKKPEVGEYFERITRPAISRRFDDVVRSMGIKELRAA